MAAVFAEWQVDRVATTEWVRTMKTARTLVAASAIALAVAGCASGVEATGTPTAPETNGGAQPPAAGGTAEEWAQLEWTTDPDLIEGVLQAFRDLIPSSLPAPGDSPYDSEGDSRGIANTGRESLVPCAGDSLHTQGLATGGFAGTDDLTESDLVDARAWLQQALGDAGWNVSDDYARWDEDDATFEYGGRGHVFLIDDGSEPWVAVLTLQLPNSLDLGYCPAQ